MKYVATGTAQANRTGQLLWTVKTLPACFKPSNAKAPQCSHVHIPDFDLADDKAKNLLISKSGKEAFVILAQHPHFGEFASNTAEAVGTINAARGHQ